MTDVKPNYFVLREHQAGGQMINNDERKKRQMAYDVAKKNSESRGVPLTQETEAIMKQYINGEISDQDFLNHVARVAEKELAPTAHLH
jgi:hypothetical protein